MPGLRTTWNKIRYTLYSPIYDGIAGVFEQQRQRSLAQLTVPKAAQILIIGAGTGLDLPYLTDYSNVLATDLTPAMLQKAKKRAEHLGMPLQTKVMNGQQIELPDASVDAVVLHLILAVIPDPYRCIQEVERVLKPGGEVVIFDKFLREGAKPGLLRRGLNLVTDFLATSINRRLGDLVAKTELELIRNEAAGLNGLFRVAYLCKVA